MGTQKNIEKQHCKKSVRGRILTSEGDSFFVAEVSLKSHKIQDTFKMCPQASKMSPRASKIIQNHENLVAQNQENQVNKHMKKLSNP